MLATYSYLPWGAVKLLAWRNDRMSSISSFWPNSVVNVFVMSQSTAIVFAWRTHQPMAEVFFRSFDYEAVERGERERLFCAGFTWAIKMAISQRLFCLHFELQTRERECVQRHHSGNVVYYPRARFLFFLPVGKFSDKNIVVEVLLFMFESFSRPVNTFQLFQRRHSHYKCARSVSKVVSVADRLLRGWIRVDWKRKSKILQRFAQQKNRREGKKRP